MPTTIALQTYARRIRDKLRANAGTPETGLAPDFQRLVEDLLPTLAAVAPLIVSPEFNKPGAGRPDIALIRQGQPPRAFIELKAPAKPADPERWRDAHDKRQYERLKELGTWSTSNFIDFHLFGRAEQLGSATIVPAKALKPDTPDATADKLIAAHDAGPFLALLATLARADAPTARNAQQLAELMAHSARLVRSAVQERVGELNVAGNAQHPLMMVRETFRNVLYAHPEAGGYAAASFDELFSSAFAQTLAFGLLLVREASGTPVDAEAWRHMPDEHPLMRATLRVLSEQEVTQEIGIGFEVMCDTVNSFAPEILAVQPDGRDPILYFYENFLQIFDPAARERYGVYYTPIEVVRYMVGALDRALRDNLGTLGLRDEAVTILDPATGTGTFLLGIAERVRDQVTADEGGPAASMALRGLASRMFAFELLVGPMRWRITGCTTRYAIDPPMKAKSATSRSICPGWAFTLPIRCRTRRPTRRWARSAFRASRSTPNAAKPIASRRRSRFWQLLGTRLTSDWRKARTKHLSGAGWTACGTI
ncbi:MAG: N-6 DNA methylase [Novosphingobium sp.]